ncbi:MAG: NUDIX domain-containing protein [Caulobacteraceae bacterium]|nr:NUDIX domain-containing protein [Caulobacteraceae bacterium]
MTPRLQFGQAEPDLEYRERPTAFGVAERDGRIACVRVDRGAASYFDLPGGAVDGEETEAEALVREFVEETGLTIEPGERFAAAGQLFRKSDGAPVHNVGGFWTASVVAEDPSAKVEADHELVWLEPARAVAELRHDAHAWAVAKWLRVRDKRGHMER